MRVPLAVPCLSGVERDNVAKAMESTWISSQGEFVDQFEFEFGNIYESRALSVSNGTVALDLALEAIDVRPGDEVIIPAMTYAAVAAAVTRRRARIVTVDIDDEQWGIDPLQLERAITPYTKAIIVAHNYGRASHIREICTIAHRHGIPVIEDAAEVHLSRVDDRWLGTYGTIGTFSFYGNKILTCGEGGAVITRDEMLYNRMRLLRGQGMTSQYWHPVVGHNYRLTNVACAILCGQLERRDHLLLHRKRVYRRYMDQLDSIGAMFIESMGRLKDSPWLFPLVPNSFAVRAQLQKDLLAQGIETRRFFYPIRSLPPYRLGVSEPEPVAASLSERGLNLPTHPQLDDGTIDEICHVIRESLSP